MDGDEETVDEAEEQQEHSALKAAFIQDPEPVKRHVPPSQPTPATVVAENGKGPPAAAVAESGKSLLDRISLKTDQTRITQGEASRSSNNAAKTEENTQHSCPRCPGSRISLYKYGSKPGVKRLKCGGCSRWFGEIIADNLTEKSEDRPPPAKIARKAKQVAAAVRPRGDSPSPADLLDLSSTPLSATATTSAQTDIDDLFLAEMKQQMAITAFDNNDVVWLRRKLKMAQVMMKESRVKISAVEKQRDDAFKLLRKLHGAVCQFKIEFHSNMRRLQEDQSFLANQYSTYLKELDRGVDKERKALNVEKTRVKFMFEHCENKRRNLKAQLECKKEQLKQSQHETAMETRRCDVLTRDAYLATSEADQAKRQLNDKLFLGTNQKCGTCSANERVRNVLANQIAEKSNENDQLKQQRDQLYRKCEEKDRICQILTKNSERLQFEVNALSKDNKRMLEESRRAAQEKEDRPPSMSESVVSLSVRQNSAQPNPSPPSSDQSNEDGAAPPSSRPKKEPHTPPQPPLPPPEPDDVIVEESEQPATDPDNTPGAIDWNELLDDKEWLRAQLEGCWELLVWYRKELKNSVEQKLYFAERLEEDTDAVETLLESKDCELARLHHALTEKTESHDELTVQLSQLTQNLSTFFNTNSDR